jgi:hypothetical protein
VGVEYLVLWLGVETHTTPIDKGCGMDFFPRKKGQTRHLGLAFFSYDDQNSTPKH